MELCDIDCQQKKHLRALSSALVTATNNKGSEPEAYDRARTAYYTAKEGQTWAQVDQEKKAEQAVQPILDSYEKRFNQMKNNLIYNSAVDQAKKDLSSTQIGDEAELRFLHSQIEAERNQAGAQQRLNELASNPWTDVYSWLPTFLDLLLGLTGLYIIYQLFVAGKFTKLTNFFTQRSNGVAGYS